MTNIEKKGYQPVVMRIYNKERQLVLEDEVLCAYDTQTNKIQAMGREARRFTEDNQIAVVNPLKWGVVADYTVFQKVMKLQVQKVMKGKLFLNFSHQKSQNFIALIMKFIRAGCLLI